MTLHQRKVVLVPWCTNHADGKFGRRTAPTPAAVIHQTRFNRKEKPEKHPPLPNKKPSRTELTILKRSVPCGARPLGLLHSASV